MKRNFDQLLVTTSTVNSGVSGDSLLDLIGLMHQERFWGGICR